MVVVTEMMMAEMVVIEMLGAEMLFHREETRGLLERRSPKDGPIHHGGGDSVQHVNDKEIKMLISDRPLTQGAAPVFKMNRDNPKFKVSATSQSNDSALVADGRRHVKAS